MSKHKNLVFYTTIIGSLLLFIYVMLFLGKENLEVAHSVLDTVASESSWNSFSSAVLSDTGSSTGILLLQIIVIMICVRLFGWICKRIGQPTVVGEILAGVVLGPSLLGLYFPEISAAIFPVWSTGSIKLLSEIGLVLFMFIVGMELDLKVLQNRADDAVLISHTCIAILFAMGITLAYFIFPIFSDMNSHFVPFALFMGIAMSITAFPVLARIVHERGLNKTSLGAMVVTCAAVDDITAWCLLAGVIAIAKAGSFVSTLYVIFFAVVYIFFMFKLVRPFLKRLADLQTSRNIIGKSVVGVFFLILFVSSFITNAIGIHPLFGAFVAGVIMPANENFRKLFIDKIEDVSLILLLPLFFVYTGLNTKIGLLNNGTLWLITLVIIGIASFGKLVGGTLVSRFVGFDWRSSVTIGTLMNTRGLMELVILNIGLDLGILTPEIFAMMVVMALITTFMTSPILNLIDFIWKHRPTDGHVEGEKLYKILVPFEDSDIGRKLLLIVNAFIGKSQIASSADLLHLSPGNTLYQYNIEQEELDVFSPVLKDAKLMEQPVNTIFEVTSEPFSSVVKLTNQGSYDFLLMGIPESIYKGNLLGQFLGFSNKILHFPARLLSRVTKQKKLANTSRLALDENTRSILIHSNAPVGIFIDKGLKEIKNVFVPIWDDDDVFVSEFVKRLAENSSARITLWDSALLMDRSIDFVKNIRKAKSVNPYLFQLWNNNIPVGKDIFDKQDLILISLRSWRKLKKLYPYWSKSKASVLLLSDEED